MHVNLLILVMLRRKLNAIEEKKYNGNCSITLRMEQYHFAFEHQIFSLYFISHFYWQSSLIVSLFIVSRLIICNFE